MSFCILISVQTSRLRCYNRDHRPSVSRSRAHLSSGLRSLHNREGESKFAQRKLESIELEDAELAALATMTCELATGSSERKAAFAKVRRRPLERCTRVAATANQCKHL